MRQYKSMMGQQLQDEDWQRLLELDHRQQQVRTQKMHRLLSRQIDAAAVARRHTAPLTRGQRDGPSMIELPRMPKLPPSTAAWAAAQRNSAQTIEPTPPPFMSSMPARFRSSDQG